MKKVKDNETDSGMLLRALGLGIRDGGFVHPKPLNPIILHSTGHTAPTMAGGGKG